ncbi:MAG: hypothetical protein IJ633_04355 [Prevotella sp.]|nr:hypothetical protein [Prevotella sp.]
MTLLRRFYSLLILSIASTGLYAQSQPGYVKTLGRPDKKGVPLSNVTIRMRGVVNAVLTGADGRFSVQMPGKKSGDAIVLQSIRKSGYELVDPSLVGRQQVFSPSVPIVIVMVNTAELAANKQRIERIAYQRAEKNYQTRLKELEKQVKEQQLTEEQYRQELQDLQDKYEKYQSLIDGMADRYARTDYDHLDSIDREINICIENGELEKADSLIHTVFDPNTVLERNRAAKEEAQTKMKLAQDVIDEANDEKERLLRIQKEVENSRNE